MKSEPEEHKTASSAQKRIFLISLVDFPAPHSELQFGQKSVCLWKTAA